MSMRSLGRRAHTVGTLRRTSVSRDPEEGGGGQNQNQGGENQNQGGDGDAGKEGQNQNQGPVDATDEHGASLGFPKDTAVKDMTPEQERNYWRYTARKVTRERDALQRQQQNGNQNQQQSGTVQNQQQEGAEKTGTVDEAAIRREIAMDAASASIRTALAARNKSAEEIDEIVDYLDTSKFLTAENKLDSAKITAFVTKTVPVRGGEGGVPGQGQQQQQSESKAAAGKAVAQARYGDQAGNQKRGTYGGLRR